MPALVKFLDELDFFTMKDTKNMKKTECEKRPRQAHGIHQKWPMIFWALIWVMVWVFALGVAPSPVAAQVDNSLWAELLQQYVKKNRVDYDGFKKNEAILDKYLAILGQTQVDNLSHNHRFAFYINAYNAFTIKLILTKYPGINSIKEIGSFFSGPWSKKFISLGGRIVSLDHIEHDILRPLFKDPRVHFAINCASKSCPPLLDKPYEGTTLDTQLDDQARAFVNELKHNFVSNNTLFVSSIFKWFEEDFHDKPLLFIRQYASKELLTKLDALGPKVPITFLDYDWTLNRR